MASDLILKNKYKYLFGILICLMGTSIAQIIFYEYDSELNGNDFEYRYSLDADNADAFLNIIPHQWADPETNIQEWLIENVDCRGRGMDLQKKWIEMGLHGTWVDWEDYPGGIHHKGAF